MPNTSLPTSKNPQRSNLRPVPSGGPHPSARLAVATVLALSLVAALLVAASASEGRHPMAAQAEVSFFDHFNRAEEPSKEALGELMTAFFLDPEDGRTNLLLGLNHLWLAAEGERSDPRVIEHLYLAERFLARAQERAPEDGRLASWLIPARTALASIEQRYEDLPELRAEMAAAYEQDPNFHSFVVGTQAFGEPRDSAEFAFGLAAMRAATGCMGAEDPSCRNLPRWPHNLEAFLVFAADFEIKVGKVERAREILTMVRAVPDFGTWPYRAVVEERLGELESRAALYADDNESNDPLSFFGANLDASCQVCHRAQ